LRDAGFRTSSVGDGIQAINDILALKPDVIVLDMGLPRLPGQDICTMVRRSPLLNRTPIVVISGASEREDKLELFERGADDFVAKPFAVDELTARVQVAWERARSKWRVQAALPE
jgi:DNA-binding response OmpR family regulator